MIPTYVSSNHIPSGPPPPPVLQQLALSAPIRNGTASSGTIDNATAGSSIVSNVAGLTVDSANRTYLWDGTGTAGTTANGLVETLAGATGSPRSSSVTVQPPGAATLGPLTTSAATNEGAPSSGTIDGATFGSAITSNVAGLVVDSAARTFTWDGNGSAGTIANGLVETLAGATNSPRSSSVTIAAYVYTNAETATYVSRITVTPPGMQKVNLDTLFTSLKSIGLAKFDVIQLYASNTSQAATLNLVSTSFTAVPNGVNFVPYRGFWFDGINDEVNTTFMPSSGVAFQQNNAFFGYYNRPAPTKFYGASSNSMVGPSSGTGVRMSASNASETMAAYINSATLTTATGVTNAHGFFAIDRPSMATQQNYIRGSAAGAPGAVTSVTRVAQPVRLGRFGNTYSEGQVCAFFAGASLTAAEHTALSNALDTYMTAVGVTQLSLQILTRPLTAQVTLPDGGTGSQPGRGWTCTGLQRLADGTLLWGNNGDRVGGDTTNASVIHTDAGATVILHQWSMTDLGLPTTNNLQGVSFEPVNSGGIRGHIYFVIIPASGNPICYKLTINDDWSVNTLVSIGSIAAMNDISYDSLRDILWVYFTTGTIARRNKNDVVTPLTGFFAIPTTGSDGDMIFYDPAQDAIEFTAGANGNSGVARRYFLALDYGGPWYNRVVTLTGATAIEGISVRADQVMLVSSDDYRHNGGANTNRMLTYNP